MIPDIRQQLIDAGMTINDDPDLDAFREAGEAAYETLGLTDVKAAIWSEIGK